MLNLFKTIIKFWLIFLTIGALFRVLLLSIFTNYEFTNSLYSILYGFRMDTIVFSGLWIIFLTLYTINFTKVLKIFLASSFTFYISLEFITIVFLQNFQSRPNYLVVDHLSNIAELIGMIFKLYPIYFILLILISLATFVLSFNYLNKHIKPIQTDIKNRVISYFLILILLFIGARSSFDASTPNQGFYTFSNKNIYNEIANNSIFSLLYAIYLSKKEKKLNYGDLDEKLALKNVQKLYNIDTNQTTLKRVLKSSFKEKKHIILVILESFGHNNIGYLNGIKATPNLDNLTKHSLYFTNMYAVGTRTSWGVSSVLTSLYPIPTREYIKAKRSQKNFWTIANELKKFNYQTSFLYAGDANFDNMKGFALANGFDRVIDQNDFNKSLKKYTWGYCDEDLYNKAVKVLKSSNKKQFLTLMTLSSHEPFDYPKNRFTPIKDKPLKGFANAVKYADYAIGEFIKKLKKENLFKDSVIAFIADHNEKAVGSFDVPVDRYKIAALIVADEFNNNPKEYSKIASQIDFAPTILDIASIDTTIPTMGTSIFKIQRDSALLLAHKKDFAYILKDKFVLFKPNKDAKTYNYKYKELKNNPKDILDGLSFIKTANYLYENQLYR